MLTIRERRASSLAILKKFVDFMDYACTLISPRC